MGLSVGWITCLVTKQGLNLKTEIIISKNFDHNWMKLVIRNKEIWKFHKYAEIKPHTLQESLGQKINKKGIRK